MALIREGSTLPDSYAYGDRAVREEIFEEPKIAAKAIITRNRYGALILNTEDVLFIDDDISEESFFARLIARLSGKQPMAQRVLENLRAALAQHRRAASAFIAPLPATGCSAPVIHSGPATPRRKA